METIPPEKWDTQELQKFFEVESFYAPYVFVVRKLDRQKGTLQFNTEQHPRYYFNFIPSN